MIAVKEWARAAGVAAALAVATPAMAQMSWYGYMSGANEVPPNGSTATGYSLITLMGNSLTVNISWSGLTGGPVAAGHIHCCTAVGSNVGVAVGFNGLPAAASGSYTNTFDLTLASTYTAGFLNNFGGGTAAGAQVALIDGLNAGRAYTNLHNATFPGGEIRANIVATPEPATIGLMAGGLLSLAGFGWRRRRAA